MENLLSYAKNLSASDEVLNWLDTAAKKALKKQAVTESELEHVLDYLVSDKAPNRLQKLSVKDALRKTEEWSKSNQKKGKNLIDSSEDIKVIHDFFDGTKIVQLLTKKALQREGFLMSHCVGGYSPDVTIYSYRDAKNMPHATFEVSKDGEEIVQVKGKGNGAIHPKYIHPILAFLKTIGLDIRPGDMRNLGYYHIDDEALKMLSLYQGLSDKVVTIAGKSYVV